MRNILLLVLLTPACASSSPTPPDVGDTAPPTDPEPAHVAPAPPMDLPPPEPEAPSPRPEKIAVDVINRCSDTTDFCVEVGRSQKQTRLAASAHEVYRMSPGDTVKSYVNQRCGEVIYEVKPGPNRQEAIVCR